MSQTKNKLQAVIQISQGLSVLTDKRSGAQSVWFPFRFADGQNGVLTLTKLTKLDSLTKKVNYVFKPDEDVDAILIQFKDEN